MAALRVEPPKVRVDELVMTPALEVKPLEPTTRYIIDGKYMDEVEDMPVQEVVEEVPASNGFDLDKWARAVAQKETQQCAAGVGRVNNCHGLRPGNTAPCTAGVTASNFCKFNTEQESYDAFKKIWSTWYTTDRFPTQEEAIKYSQDPGWRAIVIDIYNKL